MSGHFLNELRTAFTAHARRPALLHRGRTITYAELASLVGSAAALWQAKGVRPGDRVAFYTADKLPFLIGHLGAIAAGAISLPLNPHFTREEMRFFLGDSGAKLVVVGSGGRAVVEALKPDLPELAEIVDDSMIGQTGMSVPPTGMSVPPTGVSVPPTGVSVPPTEPNPAASDACLFIYSSGTTGRPKGIVHTHENLALSLRALGKCWAFTEADTVVNMLPLFHIHGLSFATHMPLLYGSCVRIEEGFDRATAMDVIKSGTVFMAVPTLYYALLELPAFRSARGGWGVRLFTCGSAPIRPEVLPELESILGGPVINRYGMSESHVITSLPLAGPWPQGSVGLPVEGIELQVVRDDGTPTAVEEPGSVRIRGANLFREYWRNPEAGKAVFASGWFDTGDLGKLDAAGMLTLVGRKNDLIITHGYNVYPQVVERVINECPGVKESAVLGVPDAKRGERVAAFVVRSDPTLDEERLRAYWADRLVYYQQPKDVRFVESLPRNSLGKVLRRELRLTLE